MLLACDPVGLVGAVDSERRSCRFASVVRGGGEQRTTNLTTGGSPHPAQEVVASRRRPGGAKIPVAGRGRKRRIPLKKLVDGMGLEPMTTGLKEYVTAH